MDPRAIIAIGVLSAVVIRDEYANWKNRKFIDELKDLCNKSAEIMVRDDQKIDYLLSLMNKYQIPIDEFDRIALKELGIDTVPKED